jgi:hypothetical protein
MKALALKRSTREESTMATDSDIVEVRRANLRRLIADWNGPAALAERLGYANSSFIVTMAGPKPTRSVTEKTARAFERKLELPSGYLDQRTFAIPAASPAAALDTTAVLRCARAVGDACTSEGIQLEEGKFNDAVAFLYGMASRGVAIDEPSVKQFVKLLA